MRPQTTQRAQMQPNSQKASESVSDLTNEIFQIKILPDPDYFPTELVSSFAAPTRPLCELADNAPRVHLRFTIA